MISKKNQNVPGNKWKWRHNNLKPMGYSKSNPKREVHNITGLPKADRNISSTQPHSKPKELGKKRPHTQKAHSE